MSTAQNPSLQRLNAICPNETIAQLILDAGYESAHQIAAQSEAAFVETIQNQNLDLSEDTLSGIYQKAVDVKQRVALLQASLKETVASPHQEGTLFNNAQEDIKAYFQGLPQSQLMFPTEQDNTRPSILSPASYFTDLMRLVEQYISQPTEQPELSLKSRRPDLWEMVLDEGTNEQIIPYLQIVNEILEQKLAKDIEADSWAYLAGQVYPWQAPFHRPLNQIRNYVGHFDKNLGDVFRIMPWPSQQSPTDTRIAREELNLSEEELFILRYYTDSSENVGAAYDVVLENDTDTGGLEKVDTFLQKSGLNRNQLESLLYQDLKRDSRRVLSLNGSDQSVAIPKAYDAENRPADTLTVECWIQTTQRNTGILIDYDASQYYQLSVKKGMLLWTTIDDAGNAHTAYSEQTVADNQWHHIAVCYAASSGLKQIYIDGRLDNEIEIEKASSIGLAATVIGQVGTDQSHFYEGLLAEVQIWHDLRNAYQIQSDMHTRLTGTEEGLWYYDAFAVENSEATVEYSLEYAPALPGHKFPHQDLLSHFFINDGDQHPLFIETLSDADGVAEEYIQGLDHNRLNRIYRFVKLAKKLKWSFRDLDWLLYSLRQREITDYTIQMLARIQQLLKKGKTTIDLLSVLWYDLKTYGQNAQGNALFHQIFNRPTLFASNLAQDYAPTYMDQNPFFADKVISWYPLNHDQENTANKEIRQRLMAALSLNEEDLSRLIEHLLSLSGESSEPESAPSETKDEKAYVEMLDVPRLSAYVNMVQLARLLKMKLADLFSFLKILKFEGLITAPQCQNINDLWTIYEAQQWMKQAGIKVADLHYALYFGTDQYETQASVKTLYLEGDIPDFMSQLWAAAQDWKLTAVALQKEGLIEAETADSLYQNLMDLGNINATGIVLNTTLTLSLSTEEQAHVQAVLDEYSILQTEGSIELLAEFFGVEIEPMTFVWSILSNSSTDSLIALLLSETIEDALYEAFAQLGLHLFRLKTLKISGQVYEQAQLNPHWFGPNELISLDGFQGLIQYRQLEKKFKDEAFAFLAYFQESDVALKNEHLLSITGWEADQLNTLLAAFELSGNMRSGAAETVQELQALTDCFDLAQLMGVDMELLLNLRDLQMITARLGSVDEEDWAQYNQAALDLFHTMHAPYDDVEWAKIYGPIEEQNLEMERDVLTATLIWKLQAAQPQIQTTEDLYEFLLIDVNMSGCMDISYQKEGINALQLYVHRCKIGLEPEVECSIPDDWWSWMENYRLWEANRKIFLYPENYINPALRMNKTPLFEELESELQQQEITDDHVTQVLLNYFDKLEDLSKLQIVDSYFDAVVHPETGVLENTLFLFGKTTTDPGTFYYRKAILDSQTRVPQNWTAWSEIQLNIQSDWITGLYAMNRLFIFWVELKQTRERDEFDKDVSITRASLKYSFLKSNDSWMQPQDLKKDMVIDINPDNYIDEGGKFSIALDEFNIQLQHIYTDPNGGYTHYLDKEDIIWNKVYALKMPEAGAEPEQIMVYFGDLTRLSADAGDPSQYAPESSTGLDRSIADYRQMLYEFLETCHVAAAYAGYTPFLPAFVLSRDFLVRPKRLVLQDLPTEGSAFSHSLSPTHQTLDIIETRNLIYENYYQLTQASAAPESGDRLIHYWPMDEGSGDMLHDWAGGLNLDIKDEEISWADAGGFELSESVLEFPQSDVVLYWSSLSSNDRKGIAIECWIKPSGNEIGTIFSYGMYSAVEDFVFLGLESDQDYPDRIYFVIDNTRRSYQLPVFDGAWHKILFSYSEVDKMLYVYLDGSLYDSEAVDFHISSIESGGFISIGENAIAAVMGETNAETLYGVDSFKYDGLLSHLKIWNYAYVPTEESIQQDNLIANLLNDLSPDHARLTKVSNQPGWSVYSNGDESLLITTKEQSPVPINQCLNQSEDAHGIWYLSYDANWNSSASEHFAISRLSSATLHNLSRALVLGGPQALFNIDIQQSEEYAFDRYNPNSLVTLLKPDQLDFTGALGQYFEEIFFHVPFLIAHTLNSHQRFEEAKKWYEYLFNPTGFDFPIENVEETEPAPELPDGVVAAWDMQEGEGLELKSESGLYHADVRPVGAEIHGASWTIEPDFPLSVTDHVLSFDGTNKAHLVENYASTNSNSFTIEMWVKTNPGEIGSCLFIFDGGTENFYLMEPQALQFSMGGQVLNTGRAINDGNWHHLAFTYYLPDEACKFYLNGQFIKQKTMPPTNLDGRILYLGQNTGGDYLNGCMAEFRVWHTARSEALIQADMFTRLSDPGSQSLQKYYPLNEGNGTFVQNLADPIWQQIDDFPLSDNRSVMALEGKGSYAAVQHLVYDAVGAISEITIAGWIKTNMEGEGVICSWDRSEYFRLSVGDENDSNFDGILWATTDQANTQDDFKGSISVADGQWHHVAVSYEAGSGEKCIYVDGVLDTHTTAHSGVNLGSGNKRYGFIGQSSEASGFDGNNNEDKGYGAALFFEGQMAGLAIWDRALTPKEIAELHDPSLLEEAEVEETEVTVVHPNDRFWRYLPLRNNHLNKILNKIADPLGIKTYEALPFDPHAVAGTRIGTYEKALVMRYIDNLLDWGDQLFAQDSWESITEATMLYVLAKVLLGNRPTTPANDQWYHAKSYDHLDAEQELNIPPYLLQMELDIDATGDSMAIPDLPYELFNPYFYSPENHEYRAYWDRVEDRLHKIRNCMNIDGIVRQLALYQPAIDPRQVIQALSSGQKLSSMLSGLSAAIPHYRFKHILAKARELCQHLIQLGQSMLKALEQKDAEALELLRVSQEATLLEIGSQLREWKIAELEAQKEALLKGKEQAEYKQTSYQEWASAGLTRQQVDTLNLMYAATAIQGTTPIIHFASIFGYVTPNIFGLSNGGSDWGNSVTAGATALSELANFLSMTADSLQLKQEYDSEIEEYDFQSSLTEYDVSRLEAEIQAQDFRIQMAVREQELHNKEIEQIQEQESFLKNKFTKEALYQWQISRLSSLYFQTYKMAYDLAKSAEKAFQFERSSNQTFVQYGHWDSLKKGLLSGESLMLNLNQMDKAYLDQNARELEVRKSISFAENFHPQLVELRSNGKCSFSLNELLFDYDYPGHYNRRIKTLTLSILTDGSPCRKIQASLIQKNNRIILEPNLDAVKFLLDEGGDEGLDSSILRSNWRNYQQIAVSNGDQGNGLFELNFQDARYLPFEGTGAISDWELRLPKAANRINFNSITDVQLEICYTALNGGDAFAAEVSSLDSLSSYSGYQYLSLKRLDPTVWESFIDNSYASFSMEVEEDDIAFNLNNISVEGQLCLIPLATESVSADFSLNGAEVDAATSFVEAPELGSWTIAYSGELDKAQLEDIVLVVPYSGELSWEL